MDELQPGTSSSARFAPSRFSKAPSLLLTRDPSLSRPSLAELHAMILSLAPVSLLSCSHLNSEPIVVTTIIIPHPTTAFTSRLLLRACSRPLPLLLSLSVARSTWGPTTNSRKSGEYASRHCVLQGGMQSVMRECVAAWPHQTDMLPLCSRVFFF